MSWPLMYPTLSPLAFLMSLPLMYPTLFPDASLMSLPLMYPTLFPLMFLMSLPLIYPTLFPDAFLMSMFVVSSLALKSRFPAQRAVNKILRLSPARDQETFRRNQYSSSDESVFIS